MPDPSTPDAPVPPHLTPEEDAHLHNLQALFATLHDAEADPTTDPATRQALLPRLSTVSAQILDVEAGAYSRNTVDLKAAEDSLGSALDQLKALQRELDHIGAKIKTAATIASALDQAISTCKSLLA